MMGKRRALGDFISYFILSKIAILDKANEKLKLPFPRRISKMENIARIGCSASLSLIRGRGGLILVLF